MKPYGRQKKIKGAPWKKDNHPRPKKDYENWWEADMSNIVPRTTIKSNWKKTLSR